MHQKSRLKFDEIGYWSEIKLDIVRDYATAYSKILSAQIRPRLSHVYIDAFAGAGVHISRRTQQFVPGSPMNALHVEPPFREYHLIDLDRKKVNALRQIVGERSEVYVYEGDCNAILREEIFPRVQFEAYRRGLCLFDPYGWNPLTGCTKISPGCKHCYAERIALRLQTLGQPNYRHGFHLTLHEHVLELPLHWKKPRIIFVNSMSDLFHQEVPVTFIQRVFEVMHQANWHCFQILTKRAERLAALSSHLLWRPHIWMGVSIENQEYTFRINYLRQTGAHVKGVCSGYV